MILLLSIEFDNSTNLIEDWLKYYQANYMRINTNNLIENVSFIDPLNDIFELNNGKVLNKSTVNVVYNRKWFINDYLKYFEFKKNDNSNIIQTLKSENEELGKYFKNIFSNAIWVDKPSSISISKLDQLYIAKSFGLNVPNTILTSHKDKLFDFIKENNSRVITKPLMHHYNFEKDNENFSSYTEIVTNKLFENLKDRFQPSLFQEYIEKKFEIRCFYIDGEFYALAQFSQQEEHTSIDIKKGNRKHKFKTQVFEMPLFLKKQLKSFMKKIDLLTGSFDIIYNTKNEYVFLEVNPVGIFENVSYLGSYSIEKKIAELLLKTDNNEKRKN